MPNIRSLQRSFGAGEVSPEMFGRIDDSRYQAGLATCRNFITTPQGPAINRQGTEFIHEVKTSAKKTRVIPFTYSTTQTMLIEMGEGYFRFYVNGAVLQFAPPAPYDPLVGYDIGDLCNNGGTDYYCVSVTTGVFNPGAWYALPADMTFEVPTPYGENDLFDIHFVQSADIMTFVHPSYAPRELRRNGATDWTLTAIPWLPTIATPLAPTVVKTGPGVGYQYFYVVTAIEADLVTETTNSLQGSIANSNLYTPGTYHTISWAWVPGAAMYNVYRYSGGVWGFIGQTSALSIIDDNISPDISMTPPTYDTPFTGAGNYPAAVSYYEQRRCFAGTLNSPQSMWMTRSGTESMMSYSIPIRDDDRIAFRVAAREANAILHIVPLSNLILLTNAAEWRITSVNSDALTPSSVSVKPQSYIGANNVQPVIINTNMIYAAARGGHLRECSYNWQSNGYITGDLCLRSAHLFDSYDILDMAYSKAPQSIVWFISSSGNLLGLTYVPEQQIGAWHRHDTTHGVFESCACIAEGTEDVLYVVVRRLINGAYVRYIERMKIGNRKYDDPTDAFFVDAGLSYDGTNVAATTMTATTGTDWYPGDVITLTDSSASFVIGDIGDEIVITGTDGYKYRFRIVAVPAANTATVNVDRFVPATSGIRAVATTAWAWARNTFSGLTHLEGETVNVLMDGAVSPQKVVAGGSVTLDVPATVVHIGLPIIADLETLPLAAQVDLGFGQGRVKNVNKAWLRVYRSSGVWVGPDSSHLVEAKHRTVEVYGDPPELRTGDVEIMLTPSWASGGQVFIRQIDPLPLMAVSLTMEISIGG